MHVCQKIWHFQETMKLVCRYCIRGLHRYSKSSTPGKGWSNPCETSLLLIHNNAHLMTGKSCLVQAPFDPTRWWLSSSAAEAQHRWCTKWRPVRCQPLTLWTCHLGSFSRKQNGEPKLLLRVWLVKNHIRKNYQRIVHKGITGTWLATAKTCLLKMAFLVFAS